MQCGNQWRKITITKAKSHLNNQRKNGAQRRNVIIAKKPWHTSDNCFHLKDFPPTHPLHGVFSKADNDKSKKGQDRKGPKGYQLSEASDSKKSYYSGWSSWCHQREKPKPILLLVNPFPLQVLYLNYNISVFLHKIGIAGL